MIRVAVAGAAGRMGQAVCAAVEGAPDMTLSGRADPVLDTALTEVLPGADVVVDFTQPDTALENALACLRAGVHVVIGTTGFDPAPLTDVRPTAGGAQANVFIAPNFAIGAVLMMRFAAEAARHMAAAEIIELHHDGKLDAPSGTAARTAQLMAAASGGPPPPIHSVRLPGLVAHQEVLLGDVAQTLTIRHDSMARESFMPGVLLAVRRVGTLPSSPVVGLEHLLFEAVISKEGQPGVLVAVTDHAVERFRQRVAARRGALDPRPEIIERVSAAWAAGRVSDEPPEREDGRARRAGPRGAVYVHDLTDRDLVFVCRHDPRAHELVVITLWERERLGAARVPRRFTDALEG